MSTKTRRPAHHTRQLTELSTPTPRTTANTPARVWGSRDFLVCLYTHEGHDRLTINRTSFDKRAGRWVDGITWDELQALKAQAGFGDRWAVEIYPPDTDVVDVAAMRHLWLLEQAPDYGWKKHPHE